MNENRNKIKVTVCGVRIENIEELISKIAEYEATEENPTLDRFLEEVALVSDLDTFDEDSDYVV